jgi:hemerythrin-like domain-containing protein
MQNPIDPSEFMAGSGRGEPDAHDAFHAKCHRALDQLLGLSRRLANTHADEASRQLAAELVDHFSMAARQHHGDEERNTFPALLATGDPEAVRAVARLQDDHARLARDWLEIEPHLEAVASGQLWYDIDVISEGTEVFSALMLEHLALEESLVRASLHHNAAVRLQFTALGDTGSMPLLQAGGGPEPSGEPADRSHAGNRC